MITAGFTSLSLGVIGIILPVIPTTPFILLAGTCFIKSSSRLYEWLISNKLFGKYISNYIKYRAITLRSKVYAIIIMWAFIISSVIFFITIMAIDILLIIIAIAVTFYLLNLKTLKDSDMVED